VKFIREYKEFSELDLLSGKSIENLDKEIIMKLLYKFRNKEIGGKLDKIIDRFKNDEQWGKYSTSDDWFEDKEYKTFMQYFKRKLSKEKFAEIKSRKSQMTTPCECAVESIGDFKDTSSILRLKKETDSVVEDLKEMGIKNIEDLSFINMKLLKVYYHRIHSPLDCQVKNIIEVSPENNFFGNNNLWIVELQTREHGKVFLVLVGELSIKDFTFKIKVGDKLNMYDEIGNFNWASQVLLIYDNTKFGKIRIKKGGKYFIGDQIY
jgi:hypothetical protein